MLSYPAQLLDAQGKKSDGCVHAPLLPTYSRGKLVVAFVHVFSL